jgi:ABC-2 type transport system ATP-binding protein
MPAADEPTPAIEIKNFTKQYPVKLKREAVNAVDNLSLTVQEGEIFGFLGPNGAGKTTTIKTLLGLIYPTQGECYVLGAPAGDIPTKQQIAYLPEEPYFYEHLTAREVIRFYAQLFGMNKSDATRRADELLDLVGLKADSSKTVRQFSKGMKQRVGIAQSLINNPRVLFYDEPTSGLDPISHRDIRDLILRLKAQGKTIFLSSHQLTDVEMVCDRVSIMDRGKLKKLGRVDDLVSGGQVEIVAVGMDESLRGRLAQFDPQFDAVGPRRDRDGRRRQRGGRRGGPGPLRPGSHRVGDAQAAHPRRHLRRNRHRAHRARWQRRWHFARHCRVRRPQRRRPFQQRQRRQQRRGRRPCRDHRRLGPVFFVFFLRFCFQGESLIHERHHGHRAHDGRRSAAPPRAERVFVCRADHDHPDVRLFHLQRPRRADARAGHGPGHHFAGRTIYQHHLAINLIPTEIEKRTIYTILSKPVRRHEFLLGKYFGALGTVLINIGLMALAFVAAVGIKYAIARSMGGDAAASVPAAGVWPLFKGVLMIYLQLVLLCSLAIFFSTFLSPLVNFFLTFSLFIIGNLSSFTQDLIKISHNPLIKGFFAAIHYVVPNFGNFQFQNPLINPEVKVANENLFLMSNVIYAVVYASVLMILAILVFDRREV